MTRDAGRRPARVLFVCTHNSARSIMAEAVLRDRGGGRYEAWSAGTDPGTVHPLAMRVLQEAGLPTDELRSKSVSELAGEPFDYVVTVCDAARQRCPVFPGDGERLHWGHDDPSAVGGSDEERLQAFRRVFSAISQQVDRFLALEAARVGHT